MRHHKNLGPLYPYTLGQNWQLLKLWLLHLMMAALSSIEILLHPENKQDGQEGCKKEGFKKVGNMLE